MHILSAFVLFALVSGCLVLASVVWRDALPKVLHLLADDAGLTPLAPPRHRSTVRPAIAPRRTNRPVRAAA